LANLFLLWIWYQSLINLTLFHYKISQFCRWTYSAGVWLAIRRWFIYRRLHWRITSVGFPFIGDSQFRRYISRKNKKTICRWFYRQNLRAKKKFPAWNIPTDFVPSVISCFTDDMYPSVNVSVSVCDTDWIYPYVNSSVSVAATVKFRQIKSVGKAVGEWYCQIPTDSFRW
jgi:hypothetical protein